MGMKIKAFDHSRSRSVINTEGIVVKGFDMIRAAQNRSELELEDAEVRPEYWTNLPEKYLVPMMLKN